MNEAERVAPVSHSVLNSSRRYNDQEKQLPIMIRKANARKKEFYVAPTTVYVNEEITILKMPMTQ